MMFTDHVLLRRGARNKIGECQPAPWIVTLVFLLLTIWLSIGVGFVLPDPMEQVRAALAALPQEVLDSSTLLTAHFRSLLASTFAAPTARMALFVNILLYLTTMVFRYGYAGYCLSTMRSEECGVGELFSRFYLAGKIILAELLVGIIVFCWSLFLLIPGLIAYLRYRMVPYILLEDPDKSVFQAMGESHMRMRGHKLDLLRLELSFFPYLLGVEVLILIIDSFTAGYPTADYLLINAANTACYVFLMPYISFTRAAWYLTLPALSRPEA